MTNRRQEWPNWSRKEEDEDAKEKICDKQKPGTSKPKTSPITPFRAVNEPESTGTPIPGDPEGTAESEENETEESTEVFLKESSEDEIELPDSGAEFENLRSGEEEYDLEPEFDLEHDHQPQVDEPHLSPEREVSFTPLLPPTKNARRNFRRRRANKKQRTQDNADKKRREINERIRSNRDKRKPLNPKRQTRTPSTEIITDSDDRASARNSRKPKSRRESQESIEELDSKGRKVPTNKYQNRRH
mgnify:CR=1 FL=1